MSEDSVNTLLARSRFGLLAGRQGTVAVAETLDEHVVRAVSSNVVVNRFNNPSRSIVDRTAPGPRGLAPRAAVYSAASAAIPSISAWCPPWGRHRSHLVHESRTCQADPPTEPVPDLGQTCTVARRQGFPRRSSLDDAQRSRQSGLAWSKANHHDR